METSTARQVMGGMAMLLLSIPTAVSAPPQGPRADLQVAAYCQALLVPERDKNAATLSAVQTALQGVATSEAASAMKFTIEMIQEQLADMNSKLDRLEAYEARFEPLPHDVRQAAADQGAADRAAVDSDPSLCQQACLGDSAECLSCFRSDSLLQRTDRCRTPSFLE